jgi:hypothetical protein
VEESKYGGLQPNMTSILAETGGERLAMRGVSHLEIRPVSAAVVIGLGGSGIQVVSRLRAGVRGNRIDQDAEDAVAFLGIDAVPQSSQQPPLPAGVDLGGDYLNLQGFNPSSYLSGQRPNDPFLQEWWDDRYEVPPGPMNEGLKRERMLGRLCFHKDANQVRRRIADAMTQAAQVRHQLIAKGDPGGAGSELPVHLISSSAGGTGSSGFLEVVMAIHAAARSVGLTPKIRAFVLLPGVFASSVSQQQMADTTLQAHRANAYGFFKELDHFLVKSSELPHMMGMPEVPIKDGELIHQVYLFDANLGRTGILNDPKDVYEIIAESLFQFLFTEMGRALLGVNGVNIERTLTDLDAFRKPRRYCSLGISRIVFPGDTFRNHLVMWWCDWMIRGGFLREPSTIELTTIHESDRVVRLIDSVSALVNRATTGHFDDVVRTFQDMGREAPRTLEAHHDAASAEDLFSTLQRDASAVTADVRSTLEVMRSRLVGEIQTVLEEAAFEDGSGVPIAREVTKCVEKSIRDQLARAQDDLNAQIATKEGSFARVEERLEKLHQAENRNVLDHVVAFVAGWFDDEVVGVSEAGRNVGEAIKDWTTAVYSSEIAQARHDFLVDAARRLERLRIELERAQERLVALAGRAKAQWERDELLGKDAGPRATTILIPDDSQPEVEFSRLSKATRTAIEEEHHRRLGGDDMKEFLSRWLVESTSRGFFDFGSDDPVTSMQAELSLLASLERDAAQFALQTVDDDGDVMPRLPTDLLDAARKLGEQAALDTAVLGLQRVSDNVCWSWEPGRFHLPPGDAIRRADLMPQVTAAVAFHPSMGQKIEAVFGEQTSQTPFADGERVVALSCEWAVPVHCLPVVSQWKIDYDLLSSRRHRQRREGVSIEPPNHIDARFESFADLVPEYFRPEEAAPRLAKALLVASALAGVATKDAVEGCYVRDHTVPPVAPVRRVRGEGFVGRTIVEEEGRLRPEPAANDKRLGTEWQEAMRGVANDVALGHSVDTTWGHVIKAADTAALLALVDGLGKSIDGALGNRRQTTAETDALAHMKNALDDIRDELRPFV